MKLYSKKRVTATPHFESVLPLLCFALSLAGGLSCAPHFFSFIHIDISFYAVDCLNFHRCQEE